MKLLAPESYQDFHCIAGACRHSCCIGWEIGIDPDSLKRFQSLPGEMGQRLRESIQVEAGGACFRLQGYEERCPFLNDDGLCDLILTLGEDSLCQICTDHPRFRHFFSTHTEIGLGLCCEAAGRLLLGDERPLRLCVLEDDGEDAAPEPLEQQILAVRSQLLSLTQDRSLPVCERIERLLPDSAVDWTEWADFLLSLERLDERWADLLTLLPDEPRGALSPALEIPLEQLMAYLLFRHLPEALEDGDLEGRVRFCALMWRMAARLCMHLNIADLDAFAELARMYSSEIEYSEENTCAILERISDELA